MPKDWPYRSGGYSATQHEADADSDRSYQSWTAWANSPGFNVQSAELQPARSCPSPMLLRTSTGIDGSVSAPMTDYRYLAGAGNETKAWSNNHYEFRWWYDFSGGKLTDWGAHHVDIATWGMDKTDTGPVSVDPVMVEHPVEFKDGVPTRPDAYNTATKFNIVAKFDDGMELVLRHDTNNGILFEGTEGRIFVNRGRLTGTPAEELKSNPLPEGAVEAVYKDKQLTNHAQNFFNCVADRTEPVSDVFSHHRALSTCHLAGIAARLGRKIKWDPAKEQVIGDNQAQSMVAREKRKGFEIEM